MMWKMAGILFGLLLLFFISYQGTEHEQDVPKQEKTVTRLENVWLKSVQNDSVTYFFEGEEYTAFREEAETQEGESFPKSEEGISEGEKVADLVFINGKVAEIHSKREKVNGKLLRRADNWLEIEGQRKYEVSDKFQGYRIYGVLETVSVEELPISSSFVDYVIEDGKICAAILQREEETASIRVLIQAGNYAGIYHNKIVLCGEGAYRIEGEGGSRIAELEAGEKIEFTEESEVFQKEKRIRIVPEALTDRIRVESIVRSQGAPAYRGSMEIVKEDAGLYLINEVLLEEYLYAVVPSEMPAGYPMEALKAQSICARTYAYRNLLHAGFAALGAHVDDGTAYQVYQNIAEQERTTQAVRETDGQVLYVGEKPAGTYYYSTSCGYGTDAGIWKGTEEVSYLRARHIAEGNTTEAGKPETVLPGDMAAEEIFAAQIQKKCVNDYEWEEPWYRWSYEVEQLDVTTLNKRLQERQQAAPEQILVQTKKGDFASGEIEEIGDILDIRVNKRREGGVIDELVIEGSRQSVKITSEYNVRYVLCSGTEKVLRQDGSEAEAAVLLPSAFFSIETIGKTQESEIKTEDGKVHESVVGYRLIGGGYGHGVGMSQNGAARMADCGMEAGQILGFFYEDGRLVNLYEPGGSRQ